MRKLVANCLVVAALSALAAPVQAQTDLTDSRTAEQKWSRMIYMSNFIFSGLLAYGEEMGQSPEEIGVWFGDFASRSWGGPGSHTLSSFVRQNFLNNNLWPGLEFEILSETEGEIRFRTNQPWAAFFGEDGVRYGVTMEAFTTAWCLTGERIADSIGFTMTHEMDGDWINFSVTTQ